MSLTIAVPPGYGYVIMSNVVTGFVIPFVMGGFVMEARKKYDVPYPNLYATPGYHKEADAFNRVQRGHQNMFESLTAILLASLVGGIKHPITSSIACLAYGIGSILFLIGYADTKLDVKMARYKKGGVLKHIGALTCIGTSISFAGSLNGWW